MFRIMWQHTLKQQSYGLVQERAPWAAICQYSVEVSSFILHGGSPWIISWYFMHPIDFTFHTADPVQNRSLTRGWSQVLFEILYHVTRWRLDCDWRLFIWWQKLHEASPWPSNHGRLQGRLHACDATRTEARRSSLHPRMAPPSCFLPGHGFFRLVFSNLFAEIALYTHAHIHTHTYIYIYYTYMITKRLPGVWHMFIYFCLNHGIPEMVHLEVLRLQRWVPGHLWRRSGALWSQLLARPFEGGQGRWGVNDMAMAWLWAMGVSTKTMA